MQNYTSSEYYNLCVIDSIRCTCRLLQRCRKGQRLVHYKNVGTTVSRKCSYFYEFECPVLVLTSSMYCISSEQIKSVISIVHLCGDACTFETVAPQASSYKSKFVFIHDTSNKLFCLNVYCMDHKT